MGKYDYYEAMKALAQNVRSTYAVRTENVSLSLLRNLYKAEGIVLDYWDHKLRKVRGAYIVVEGEPHVMINAGMSPKQPRIFTLAHELKHHMVDRELAEKELLGCQLDPWAGGSHIEIGAEIFAAEFVYPELECLELIDQLELRGKKCSPSDVVTFKRACPAPVSYSFIVKRLEWFNVIEKGQFQGVHFQKLEEQIYGLPFYKVRRRH